LSGTGADAVFSGSLPAVPWGRDVAHVVTVLHTASGPQVLLLARAAATLTQAANLAGEPRDTLKFASAPVQAAPATTAEALALFDHCALLRVTQIVGALESALHRSIQYAGERKQFGRAIGKFQAVQQQLAQFGADTAATSCAARAACRAATRGNSREFQI